MWGFLAFIGAIYIAVRIIKEESGNGDFYRSMGDIYKGKNEEMRKAYYKKGSESDGAVGCCTVFLIFIGIIVLLALCGVGQ